MKPDNTTYIFQYRLVRLWFFTCLLGLCLNGCTDSTSYSHEKIPSSPQQASSVSIVRPEPPPEGHYFDKTLYVEIETDPRGASVSGVERIGYGRHYRQGKRLGVTPLAIPIRFCEWGGQFWVKPPYVYTDDPTVRPTTFRGEPGIFNLWLYIEAADFYPVIYIVQLKFVNQLGNTLDAVSVNIPLKDIDGYHLKADVLGSKLILVPHGRVFVSNFSEAIERGDYYGAEELRLSRIRDLREALDPDHMKNLWGVSVSELRTQRGWEITEVYESLMVSELEQLRHVVGLLDPQLMALRKQLLAKLHEGNIEAGLALAQAVAAMEKKYFPEPPPQPVIVQAPTQTSVQSTSESQVPQSQSKQEIVIQQRPYYGVQNIVEAVGAMRGSKLQPEAYQKALGGAQLLDILGFGAALLNK